MVSPVLVACLLCWRVWVSLVVIISDHSCFSLITSSATFACNSSLMPRFAKNDFTSSLLPVDSETGLYNPVSDFPVRYPPTPIAIAPAARATIPVMPTTDSDSITRLKPTVKAKGTTTPSDMPITSSERKSLFDNNGRCSD